MEAEAVKDVRAAIEKFRDAVQGRDVKALATVVAQEPDIVFYGSQAGDKQVGWPAIKASFEEQFRETSSVKSDELGSTIKVNGDMAWAAYDLRYHEVGGSKAGTFDTRWSCVLRRYKDGWKLVHMHHSRGR
jgi:ketosteroid isomerase-like protein